MSQQIKELDFDIRYLESQIRDLNHVIKYGNWLGYSESLLERKRRLKRYSKDLEQLKNKRNVIKKNS